jgi:hypothetical protein
MGTSLPAAFLYNGRTAFQGFLFFQHTYLL